MRDRVVFLGISVCALLLVLVLTVKGRKEPPPLAKPVTLIVASDLHFLAPELTDHGEYFQSVVENADGKVMEYCDEVVDAFLEQVIDQAPDALILSGDLTFNGARRSHEILAEKLRRVADAGISVLVLPGNHDLSSSMAASFRGNSYTPADSIDSDGFAEVYQDFGFRSAVSCDPASLSYIVELEQNLSILMIDANTAEAPGQVKQETLGWIKTQLARAERNGARILSVTHQNLLQHNSVFSSGFILENAEALLPLLRRHLVICNLSGHMHIQHIAGRGSSLPDIATASLMVSPNQYGVLMLDQATAEYRTKTVDVSPWARHHGLTDPNLRNFVDYSGKFFYDTAYRQAMEETENTVLADFFAKANASYFAGQMDALDWNETLYQDWTQYQSFLSVYLQSIAAGRGTDQTTFSFQY